MPAFSMARLLATCPASVCALIRFTRGSACEEMLQPISPTTASSALRAGPAGGP
jgi:hypothetical protein